MKRFLLLLLTIAILIPSALFAEREVVDKIIAVVGDEVILASELASQLQMMALQMKEQPKTEAEVRKFQKDILEEMVSDRLFLLAARDDTTIKIRDEEIEQMLDEQVARISMNFNTYDDFLAALAKEGLTVRDLKKKYRDDVKNQILKQRFIQQKLYSVSVSKQEVVEFYNTFKDSIPPQPEAVKLAHILITFKPSPAVEDSVKTQAEEIRQRILKGADFATLSAKYSSDASGATGGDLGYLSRDDVVPEFARSAFSLNVGDISGVVRTEFGYHIIKCEGKQDERLHLRHILLSVKPSQADSIATRNLADSLLNEAWNGGDFAELAKAFSDDNDTRPQGGELGWFAIQQLPPEFTDAVSGWTEPGEVRGPIQTQFGLHLLRLLDYQKERIYSLDEDYDKIKELARQDKTGRIVDEWIQDIKEKTYISYNIEL